MAEALADDVRGLREGARRGRRSGTRGRSTTLEPSGRVQQRRVLGQRRLDARRRPAAARSRRARARRRPRRGSGRARRRRRRARRRSAPRRRRRRGATMPGPTAEPNGRECAATSAPVDDADHARQRERGGGVDRADARVREGRAHDRRAADVGQRVEVVDEPALAAQQGVVLDAQRTSGRRVRAPARVDGSGSPRSGMINRCREPERAILAPWRQPREPRSPPSTGRCACSRSWPATGRSARPSSPIARAAPRPRRSASRARCRRAASSCRTRIRPTASGRAACCSQRECTRASTSAARRCRPWRRCATRPARRCSSRCSRAPTSSTSSRCRPRSPCARSAPWASARRRTASRAASRSSRCCRSSACARCCRTRCRAPRRPRSRASSDSRPSSSACARAASRSTAAASGTTSAASAPRVIDAHGRAGRLDQHLRAAVPARGARRRPAGRARRARRRRGLAGLVARGGRGGRQRVSFADLGFAKVDLERDARQGAPEAVLAEGKTPDEIEAIVRALRDGGASSVLVTRADEAARAAVRRVDPGALEHERARCAWIPVAPPARRRPCRDRLGRHLGRAGRARGAHPRRAVRHARRAARGLRRGRPRPHPLGRARAARGRLRDRRSPAWTRRSRASSAASCPRP